MISRDEAVQKAETALAELLGPELPGLELEEIDDIENLVQRYRRRGALLDSNLLPTFGALGLPDSAILTTVGHEVLLISADENLTSVAAHQGCAVLPFYLLQQLDS